MTPENNKYNIPDIENNSNTDTISDDVANHPVEDAGFYVISFWDYKTKACELEQLEKSSCRKALRWIKDVCLCSSFEEIRLFGKGKPIVEKGEYETLFNGLPADVEIKEYILASTNRIFYYIDDGKKRIHCILFKSSHIETK